MGWWDLINEKAQIAVNQVVQGANWLWDNATVANVSSVLFKFTANTTFHLLEEGLALRKAVPTLMYNEQAQRIIKGMAYVAVYDVIPIVTINTINNSVQNYFRQGYEEEKASTVYLMLINVLTVSNYLVTAYSWQRGSQTVVRVAVLDSFAPTAFNSNKPKDPPSLCIEYKCSEKRKLKGLGRELGVLWANDFFIGAISYIPYVGSPVSRALSIMNNGRYITRVVTPERCERHKFIEQEFALALGLTFELNCWLMDKAINSITGPLPYLYLRALRHLLLDLHVNVAAHMSVPLVEKNATLPVDLFNYYERMSRFIIDVFWAGLLKRVPIDFKPEQGCPAFIPLSSALQFGVRIFNYDLQRENGFLAHPIIKKTKDFIMPPMFRNAYGFTLDPVIHPYWPEICKGVVITCEQVENYSNTKLVAAFARAPGPVARLLNLKFGIPRELTKIFLTLSKEEDFLDFIRAVQSWVDRHDFKEGMRLANPATPLLALRDDKELESLPVKQKTSVAPVQELLLDKARASVIEVVEAEKLFSVKTTAVAVSSNAACLFSTRRRSSLKHAASSPSQEAKTDGTLPLARYSTSY